MKYGEPIKCDRCGAIQSNNSSRRFSASMRFYDGEVFVFTIKCRKCGKKLKYGACISELVDHQNDDENLFSAPVNAPDANQ